jgi:flagellar hook-basal body complex protein FliE
VSLRANDICEAINVANIGTIDSLDSIQMKPLMLQAKTDVSDIFEDALNAAKAVFEQTNDFQKKADSLQTDFAAGRTDDMLAVMLAQSKAYQSLNFTVQTINRVVDSYKEIMRMQL